MHFGGWMATRDTELGRSLQFGTAAMGQILTLGQPAYPRNYEVWYTHATGVNASLSQKINLILGTAGTMSQDELENLYTTFLRPADSAVKMEQIGSSMQRQIDHVITSVDSAQNSVETYGQSLTTIASSLEPDSTWKQFQPALEHLLMLTQSMQRANEALKNRLVQSRRQMLELQTSLEGVRTEAATDPLTGLSNRKGFDAAIESAIASGQSSGGSFSLLICDIDHFKRFNDNFGHLIGDQVLKLVASVLKKDVRGNDVAARYGGEEFAIILPGSSLDEATAVAERIRRTVVNREIIRRSSGEYLGRVTLSIGIAYWRAGDTTVTLIDRADRCLYAAKRAGRNRVVSEAGMAQSTPDGRSAA